MTVETELRQARDLFDGVTLLERAAAELDESSPTREELLAFARRQLAEAAPVRVSVAAGLLGMDAKTVRAWIAHGVLRPTDSTGYQRLELDRVHQVWSLVRRLRDAKKVRGLLDEVWRRLMDDALINSAEFQESLAQMRRGEGVIVRPLPDA
jgi:hypothetical protein